MLCFLFYSHRPVDFSGILMCNQEIDMSLLELCLKGNFWHARMRSEVDRDNAPFFEKMRGFLSCSEFLVVLSFLNDF